MVVVAEHVDVEVVEEWLVIDMAVGLQPAVLRVADVAVVVCCKPANPAAMAAVPIVGGCCCFCCSFAVEAFVADNGNILEDFCFCNTFGDSLSFLPDVFAESLAAVGDDLLCIELAEVVAVS